MNLIVPVPETNEFCRNRKHVIVSMVTYCIHDLLNFRSCALHMNLRDLQNLQNRDLREIQSTLHSNSRIFRFCVLCILFGLYDLRNLQVLYIPCTISLIVHSITLNCSSDTIIEYKKSNNNNNNNNNDDGYDDNNKNNNNTHLIQ